MNTTLTQKDFDRISYSAGLLQALGHGDMAHALGELVRRQRELGNVPTESAAAVADRLGDPALAKKFAQQANEQRAAPYRTMKERNATAEAIEAAQRAGKVVAGSARPVYGELSLSDQQPNVDDRRRANMLPQSFAFRVTTGRPENVFFARRVPSVGGGGFEVEWLTGEKRAYLPEWVAMQLRLDRWRPTHDPITVGGES